MRSRPLDDRDVQRERGLRDTDWNEGVQPCSPFDRQRGLRSRWLFGNEEPELHLGALEAIAVAHVADDRVQVLVVEARGPLLDVRHGLHEPRGLTVAGQASQAVQVLLTKERGHDDAAAVGAGEFSVHHQARQAAVAIVEWVHLCDQEHGQKGPGGACWNAGKQATAFDEGTRTSSGATNSVLPARLARSLNSPGPTSGRHCIWWRWRTRSCSSTASPAGSVS